MELKLATTFELLSFGRPYTSIFHHYPASGLTSRRVFCRPYGACVLFSLPFPALRGAYGTRLCWATFVPSLTGRPGNRCHIVLEIGQNLFQAPRQILIELQPHRATGTFIAARNADGTILTRIVTDGTITLDPPKIEIAVADIYSTA